MKDAWVRLLNEAVTHRVTHCTGHGLGLTSYTGVTRKCYLVQSLSETHSTEGVWERDYLYLNSLMPHLRLITKELHDSFHLFPSNLPVHLGQEGVQSMKLLQGNTSSPSLRIRGQHFTEGLQSFWQGLHRRRGRKSGRKSEREEGRGGVERG